MKEQIKAGEPHGHRGPSCLSWHEESSLGVLLAGTEERRQTSLGHG